ncbi:MAG: sensor histidine kinase [Janthinobacterium lividum]
MKPRQRSLRTGLLLWLIIPMAIFGVAAACLTYVNAHRTADLLQDAALLAAARVMAADVRWSGDNLVASVSPGTIQIVGTPEGDQVFYRIEVAGGAMIAGTSAFPVTALVHSPQWVDASVASVPIRVVSLERAMFDDGKTVSVIVSVGRTQIARDALVSSLWKPQLAYILGSLVAATLLICAGLWLELRPLARLAAEIAAHPSRSRARIAEVDLHAELRPLVAAFNVCLDVIERHAVTQRRFIADAAHQIRTPLTVLGTQLQFARRQGNFEEVRGTLLAMHHSNRAMVLLINQLLMLAQAEAASYTAFKGATPVNLCDVIARTVEKLALMAQRKNIELTVSLEDALTVNGNESLLAAAFANLVDNAIRYTPEGKRVAVEARRVDGDVSIDVIDEGPGIPPDLREHVFEPFFRASTEEGSGLGLAIAREIVRAHGGSLGLKGPVFEIGTVASVVLPFYES